MNDPILQRFLPIIIRDDPSASPDLITPHYNGRDHYVFVVNNKTGTEFQKSRSLCKGLQY